MTLKDLKIGEKAMVFAVGAEGSIREHLLDMGLIPGVDVEILKYAPLGDPVEVLVQGCTLSLPLKEAEKILVERLSEEKASQTKADENFSYDLSLHEHNAHPGLGEGGKYHSKDHANPLPKGAELSFAIVGQKNCGKTALFNALTGANEHVGNFPGLTVEVSGAPLKGRPNIKVFDLPGIQSMTAYAEQEEIARDFLYKSRPKAIINVVDAGSIERNLYLTIQLMELGIPMVLALNMMDEVRSSGGAIRVNEMERILGIPVVAISAAKNEGIEELVEHAVHIASFQEAPARQDFCDKNDFNGAVHRCLHGIMHLVEDHSEKVGVPPRFAASRIVSGDHEVIDALALSQNELEMIEHIIVEMEQERGLDRNAAMADMRYTFVRKLCEKTVKRPQKSKGRTLSDKIDRILTGKWTAIPIFVVVMLLILWMSIDLIGAPLQELLAKGIGALGAIVGSWMETMNVTPAIRSLVIDAIFGGVGAVVSFVPIIIVLFFFLSLLEDSGYMARVAFLTDKLLRKIGLSGRSIVPLLIGFGCSVPSVMAARTLPSARDRRKTIMLIPFMSCSSKIPVYALFSSAFFPGHGGVVLCCLYLLGIIIGIAVSLVSKAFDKKSKASPFVMELPTYRLPRLGNLSHLVWDKCKDFLKNAFSVVLVATIAIWFLQSFNFHFRLVEGGEGSMLAWIAGVIAPIFSPLGLGDWKIVTALISGFLAKETMVSTLGVLGAMSSFTALTAIPMLVFSLLYTPCVATIAAVKRELGLGRALGMVAFQCILAWVCALLARLITGLIL